MMQECQGLNQKKGGGETPGRYHLLRLIGQSNSGETWLADDPLLHRHVVIKMLPPQNQCDLEYAARFERETQALAKLNHSHILPIHDYGEFHRANGEVVSYLVMPYIEGGPLDELLHRPHLSPEEVLILLAQAAEALDYAHAQGALHSHLKPSNMLLLTDRRVLVADFGLAHIVDASHTTRRETTARSPEYVAPEQLEGETTTASDRYSLAAIAYHLLTGHPPFQTKKGSSFWGNSRTPHMPTPPRRWSPALSPASEEVLLRGLARRPEERYPSAHEFVEALNRSLATPDRSNPGVTRRNLLIGAGLTVLVGGGIWATVSGRVPFLASLWPSSSTNQGSHPDEPTKILRGHHGHAHALAWSSLPGSIMLASVSNTDATVKLWNLQTFTQQQTIITQSSLSKDLRLTQLALAWSPDGHALAIGGADAQGLPNISVYRSDLSGPVTGLEQGLTLPAATLNGLGWMKQTFLVALTTPAQANEQHFLLNLWDTQKPALKLQPASIQGTLSQSGYASTYRSLAISHDGARLAIGTMQGALVGSAEPLNNTVRWQPASFGLLQYHQGALTGNAINELAWWPGGSTLLGIIEGKPDAFVYWSKLQNNPPPPPAQIKVLNDTPDFTAIAMYPNTLKNLYAAGTRNGLVYLWDEQAGQLPMRILKGGAIQGSVISLAWSPDGAWLAASYDDSDASIAIWGL